MILTQYGLRRNYASFRRLAIGIALILSPAAAVLCAQWDRKGAERAWEDATRLRETLTVTPEPSRESYLKCIQTYQQVYYRDPHYSASPEAIWEAGKLYQEMAEMFQNPAYFRNAARLYRYLTKDYDVSPRCPDALLRLATLSDGPLQDPAGAAEARALLKKRYRSSPEAKSLAAGENSTAAKAAPLSAQSPAVIIPPPSATAPTAASPAPVTGRAVGPAAVKEVRFWSNPDYTRVSIVSDGEVNYRKSHLPSPERVFFDLAGAKLDRALLNKVLPVDDKFVKQVRIGQNKADVVRIVLDLSVEGAYSLTDRSEPFGITIDIRNKGTGSPNPPASTVTPPAAASAIEKRPASTTPPSSETKSPAAAQPERTLNQPSVAAERKANPLPPPPVELKPVESGELKAKAGKPVEAAGTPAAKDVAKASIPPVPVVSMPPPAAPKVALPTSRGDRTMTRMLGLKIGRIVLDPGHGGYDTGTIGPGGMLEKDLVLNLAKNLQKLLEDKLGAEVILTRNDDTFISLEERTQIANEHQADLFVSIHANSSSIKSISGVETYFLDFARTDAAREVAAHRDHL